MTFDIENLGPAPDIDSIDTSTMDFGSDTEPAPEIETEPVPQETLEKEVAEANGEKTDEVEEEQPRDDKGRFAEKEPRIPKSRFDEQVGKEREAREAAERRAAELEARLAKQEAEKTREQARSEQLANIDEKVSALEEKYQELLLDGNTKEAAQVMKEIRLAERQVAKMEAQEESAAIVSQELERQRFQVAVARLEADHTVLNPQSEDFDPDLVSMILLVQRDMVGSGVSPSEAITEATRRVMARVAPAPKKEEPAGLAAGKVVEDRTKAAVEKALATQAAQPASLKEVGFDSDKAGEKGLPDVSKLTADEFDALPKATKDRLMGNLV